MLAEVFAAQGDSAGALAALTQAFDATASTGARYEEVELHRLRGETLLAQAVRGGGVPPRGEAEACFRSGLEVARRQEARGLELRCATSLARLLHRRGEAEEARRVLVPIYGSFTEGFETADLQAARALLAKLG